MNIWNVKDLPLPPVNTYKATHRNIDLKYLYETCKGVEQFFENNNFMKSEYLVLSRIIYRMKQKFRSAKDFKALEKVHKAIENYFSVPMSKYASTLMGLLPLKYENETYLPTKNLLDYVLVRFQGLVKLMERIVETCKIAGFLLDARIKTGHFWKIAFISFSLISRVYTLAKYSANRICEFYDSLLPFSSQLQNIKIDWLPTGYMFPKDLKAWLNVDWLEMDDDIQIIETATEIPEILQFFDLINDDDDDVEFCDEYIMVDDEETDLEIIGSGRNAGKNNQSKSSRHFYDTDEDLGEVINIEDSFSMFDKNDDDKATCNESIEIVECVKTKKKASSKKSQKTSKQSKTTKNWRYYDTGKDLGNNEEVIDIVGLNNEVIGDKARICDESITKIGNSKKRKKHVEKKNLGDLSVICIKDNYNNIDENMNNESVIEIKDSTKKNKNMSEINKHTETRKIFKDCHIADENNEVIEVNESRCDESVIEIVDQSFSDLESSVKKKRKVGEQKLKQSLYNDKSDKIGSGQKIKSVKVKKNKQNNEEKGRKKKIKSVQNKKKMCRIKLDSSLYDKFKEKLIRQANKSKIASPHETHAESVLKKEPSFSQENHSNGSSPKNKLAKTGKPKKPCRSRKTSKNYKLESNISSSNDLSVTPSKQLKLETSGSGKKTSKKFTRKSPEAKPYFQGDVKRRSSGMNRKTRKS